MFAVSLEIELDADTPEEAAKIFQEGMLNGYAEMEMTYFVRDTAEKKIACVKLPGLPPAAASSLDADVITAAALAMSQDDRKKLILALESSLGWHNVLTLGESDVRGAIDDMEDEDATDYADVTDEDIAAACDRTASKYDTSDWFGEVRDAAMERAKEYRDERLIQIATDKHTAQMMDLAEDDAERDAIARDAAQ